MEVKPYNIRVTLSFPPDTDTPGFQEELKTKPEETKLISEMAGLFKAENVAKRMVDDALKGKFLTYLGLDGWMVTHLTAGMSSPGSVFDVLLQTTFLGLFRAISIGYNLYFDSIVNRCKTSKEQDEEKQKDTT